MNQGILLCILSTHDYTPYTCVYCSNSYSSNFDCEPWAVLSYKDTGMDVGTYVVDTYSSTIYSDVVATITSTLISYFIAIPAPAIVAAAILAAMIGYTGSEIINGIISVSFRETYDCVTTTYTIRAQVMGPGMGETDKIDYTGGTEQWVRYRDSPESDIFYNGWTPGNWQNRTFAKEIWDDSVPFWPPFPCVKSYSVYL